MIEIIRAKSAGFCFGVERIVKMAEALTQQPAGPVYCLGELIHNPQEVERIRAQGMRFITGPDELPPLAPGQQARVLIRAHGVAPQVKRAITERGYQLSDGTCPLVTIPHQFARKLVQDGYRLVIMGHREHPEIRGILGELADLPEGRVDVVSGPEELERLELRAGDRVGLISQTTHPYERFARLVGEVLARTLEVRAYNTICQATSERQGATLALAKEVPLLIVVGGRRSSNTNRLVEIASLYTECYHLEDAAELKKEWFNGVEKVGIAAGASTPERSIQEVELTIRALVGDG